MAWGDDVPPGTVYSWEQDREHVQLIVRDGRVWLAAGDEDGDLVHLELPAMVVRDLATAFRHVAQRVGS